MKIIQASHTPFHPWSSQLSRGLTLQDGSENKETVKKDKGRRLEKAIFLLFCPGWNNEEDRIPMNRLNLFNTVELSS